MVKTKIEIECSIRCKSCQHYHTLYCEDQRCVACIVDNKPDSNCIDTSTCAKDTAEDLIKCSYFKLRDWDE